MSFLQPMLLAALPLVALPIIIHLINQRRYQTVRWAAMMFLLAANRMSRGYARLRQWLIMAVRMAGDRRPDLRRSAGRWPGAGWAWPRGGRADTTIVLLDRSPSMQQTGAGGGRLEARDGPAAARPDARDARLGALGPDRRARRTSRASWSRSPTLPRPRPSAGPIERLGRHPGDAAGRPRLHPGQQGRAAPRSGSAPTSARTTGTPTSGRWQALRDAFLEFPQGVRFHLLAYPQTAPGNLAVRVTDVRRQKTGDGGRAAGLAAAGARGGGDGQGDGPRPVRDRRGAVRGGRRDGRPARPS